MNKIFKIALAIIIAEMAGLIGSIFTSRSISEWYVTLTKPELSPPNWVFAPVWTTLFALMGIASYLVWQKRKEKEGAKIALKLYAVQLVLNTAWSIIFFGLRSPGWALAEILVLWATILATIIYFKRISRPAAWLLVPYIIWVTFAVYLTYSIWRLN